MKDRHNRELLAKAKQQTKLNENGWWTEDDLLATLETLVIVDVKSEKRRIAKAILDSETKPGGTEDTGQLCFEGMEPYSYEPYRLIRDDEGNVTEQDKSVVKFKFAESSRAAKHSREAAEWAERKRKEVELYAQWVIKQREHGRRKNLTFGDFVREAGLFKPFDEAVAS